MSPRRPSSRSAVRHSALCPRVCVHTHTDLPLTLSIVCATPRLAEEGGIVFIDEIDKITSSSGSYRKADASDEGVQRDLLPLVEGSLISTK